MSAEGEVLRPLGKESEEAELGLRFDEVDFVLGADEEGLQAWEGGFRWSRICRPGHAEVREQAVLAGLARYR